MYIKKNKELSLLAEQQQKQPQKAVSSPYLTDWAGVNQKSQKKKSSPWGNHKSLPYWEVPCASTISNAFLTSGSPESLIAQAGQKG